MKGSVNDSRLLFSRSGPGDAKHGTSSGPGSQGQVSPSLLGECAEAMLRRSGDSGQVDGDKAATSRFASERDRTPLRYEGGDFVVWHIADISVRGSTQGVQTGPVYAPAPSESCFSARVSRTLTSSCRRTGRGGKSRLTNNVAPLGNFVSESSPRIILSLRGSPGL
jgi:hypothetical protein